MGKDAQSESPDRLLPELEVYYDAAPRSVARVEQIGPFTLFVNPGPGFPYYARPSLGEAAFDAQDVQRVRARQRELGVPESFEWVAEATPALIDAARAAALAVSELPLMVLLDDPEPSLAPTDVVEVRLATVQDDVALLNAIARVASAAPGTAVGSAGLEEARAVVERDAAALAFRHERMRSGKTVMALALVDGLPVGTGIHQPVGSVTEIVGLGVLPAYRRRGIAGELTRCLVDDALQRGVQTVFLSAGDETISRVYQRVGFRRVATACIAEPIA